MTVQRVDPTMPGSQALKARHCLLAGINVPLRFTKNLAAHRATAPSETTLSDGFGVAGRSLSSSFAMGARCVPRGAMSANGRLRSETTTNFHAVILHLWSNSAGHQTKRYLIDSPRIRPNTIARTVIIAKTMTSRCWLVALGGPAL
jgi:hypothetical protein